MTERGLQIGKLAESYNERYKHDALFHELVDKFAAVIRAGTFTASDLRGATWIAHEIAERARMEAEAT